MTDQDWGDPPPPSSTLDYHHKIIAQVVAHLADQGLSAVDLDVGKGWNIMTETRGHDYEVSKTFVDIMQWMQDEGIIRVAKTFKPVSGDPKYFGVQLTSKGLSILKSPIGEGGPTVERKISDAKKDHTLFASIGEFIGGAAGGFTKSMTT